MGRRHHARIQRFRVNTHKPAKPSTEQNPHPREGVLIGKSATAAPWPVSKQATGPIIVGSNHAAADLYLARSYFSKARAASRKSRNGN